MRRRREKVIKKKIEKKGNNNLNNHHVFTIISNYIRSKKSKLKLSGLLGGVRIMWTHSTSSPTPCAQVVPTTGIWIEEVILLHLFFNV